MQGEDGSQFPLSSMPTVPGGESCGNSPVYAGSEELRVRIALNLPQCITGAFALALACLGCSLPKPARPIDYIVVDREAAATRSSPSPSDAAAVPVGSDPLRHLRIAVAPVRVPELYSDDRIAFRQGAWIRFLQFSRWSTPAREMVHDALILSLDAIDRFESVERAPGGTAGAEFVVEGEVRHLFVERSPGEGCEVRLSFAWRLIQVSQRTGPIEPYRVLAGWSETSLTTPSVPVRENEELRPFLLSELAVQLSGMLAGEARSIASRIVRVISTACK